MIDANLKCPECDSEQLASHGVISVFFRSIAHFECISCDHNFLVKHREAQILSRESQPLADSVRPSCAERQTSKLMP
jgi:transposase-like protein